MIAITGLFRASDEGVHWSSSLSWGTQTCSISCTCERDYTGLGMLSERVQHAQAYKGLVGTVPVFVPGAGLSQLKAGRACSCYNGCGADEVGQVPGESCLIGSTAVYQASTGNFCPVLRIANLPSRWFDAPRYFSQREFAVRQCCASLTYRTATA